MGVFAVNFDECAGQQIHPLVFRHGADRKKTKSSGSSNICKRMRLRSSGMGEKLQYRRRAEFRDGRFGLNPAVLKPSADQREGVMTFTPVLPCLACS